MNFLFTDHFAIQPKEMNLVDIMPLTFYDRDYLILQTEHPNSPGLSKLSFFTYLNNKFRNVYEMYQNGTQTLIPILFLLDKSCYASYQKYNRIIEISCAFYKTNGELHFEPFDILTQSTPIIQV